MATFQVASLAQQSGQPPVVATVTGAAPDQNIRWEVVIGAVALVAAASAVGWLLWEEVDPAEFVPRSDYTALALVVLFATALERLMEPFSRWLLPDKSEQEGAATAKQDATAKAADPAVPATTVKVAADHAAAAEATLKRKKGERAVVHWAVATTLAFTGPALFGVFLLRVVSAAGSSPNRFLDMLLTALIVGAGTKPLHDAIASIQAKKQSSEAGASSA